MQCGTTSPGIIAAVRKKKTHQGEGNKMES